MGGVGEVSTGITGAGNGSNACPLARTSTSMSSIDKPGGNMGVIAVGEVDMGNDSTVVPASECLIPNDVSLRSTAW